MRTLAIESLSARSFRNLEHVDLELGPRLNVVAGENGQGKTNLLEAAYVLATSKSFRTAKMAELLMHEAPVASVRATIREDGERRTQSVGLRARFRSVAVDEKRPATLAQYALHTPVVVFHPGSLSLSTGSGVDRRRLLDRIALYSRPAVLGDAAGYARALRARQRVLEQRGVQAPDLDGWEELVVRHGVALSEARSQAAAGLEPAVNAAFARIAPPGLSLTVRYERSAPGIEAAYREELASRRGADRARRSASVGPHRDDLALDLAHRPARGTASQGQHRAIVLALALAEIAVIAAIRDVRPVLLLDDVSSELDRARTTALFGALGREESQVLLTTTRPELIDTRELGLGDRRDMRIAGGRVEAV